MGFSPWKPCSMHKAHSSATPRCRRRQLKASASLMADSVVMGRLRTTRFDNEDDLQPLTWLAAQILDVFFGGKEGEKMEHVSNEKKTWLFRVYRGLYMVILPSYVWIIINHYEDPYYPTSIMERKLFFFRGSCLFLFLRAVPFMPSPEVVLPPVRFPTTIWWWKKCFLLISKLIKIQWKANKTVFKDPFEETTMFVHEMMKISKTTPLIPEDPVFWNVLLSFRTYTVSLDDWLLLLIVQKSCTSWGW